MEREELLTHADFIRSLARRLVRDEHQAADVEQNTWLAALEHPPASDRSIKAWFSRVLRNMIVTMHRGEQRRTKHENAVESTPTVTSPEEIAMRKEALRHLTEAVLHLDEPYLSTIILRFYENLPARDVAARLAVPHETVKTRIQRGLDQLRTKLDHRYGGDRKTWCLALAPLAGLHLAASAAAAAGAAAGSTSAASAAASAEIPGSLLFSAKLKIALAATVLLVGTSVILFKVLPGRTPHSDRSESVPAAASERLVAEGHAADGSAPPTHGPIADANHDMRDRIALEPTGLFISGTVTDSSTGQPVEAYDFQLTTFVEGEGWTQPIHETVRDREGRFRFPIDASGEYHLSIWASCYTRQRIYGLEISEEKTRSDLEIELDPGLGVSGRVVDDVTGEPVAGAIVGPALYPRETNLPSLYYLDYSEVCIYDRTDESGAFNLRGLRKIDKKVAAVHPDYAEGYASTIPGGAAAIEIRLKKGFRITGLVLDDARNPAENVLIRMYGDRIPLARPTMSGPDGRYTTEPVLPGRVVLKAGDPPIELRNDVDFSEEHKVVYIVDRDVEVDFGPKPEHVTWRGTLYGYDGEPLGGGRLLLRHAMFNRREPHAMYNRTEADWYRLTRDIRCDDQGRFEVDKLHRGRYRVTLEIPDQVDWGNVPFETSGLVERDINLSLVSTLSGVVVNEATGKPFIGKRGTVRAHSRLTEICYSLEADIDGEGRFEIKGVLPGSYYLRAQVDNAVSDRIKGIKVDKGRRLNGLVIPVAPAGFLKISMEGFENDEDATFTLSLSEDSSGQQTYMGKYSVAKTISKKNTFTLDQGEWTAALSFERLGYIQNRFDVLPDQTTEITIRRDAIVLRENFISTAGTVTQRDGSPKEGVLIRYNAVSVPMLPEENRYLHATTDKTGRYTLSGLKPGRWQVSAELAMGGRAYFPELWIPPDAETPLRLDLALPASVVSGSLYDELNGIPFTNNHPRCWEVFLHDVGRDKIVSRFSGNDGGNRFRLACSREGDHELIVNAEGYDYFKSGAFRVAEDQDLYMGDIQLKPCGLIDLEVLDESLAPIERIEVTCDGTRIYSRNTIEGRRRYDKLPTGTVTITVDARGYFEKAITVKLLPGRPVKREIVLQPE